MRTIEVRHLSEPEVLAEAQKWDDEGEVISDQAAQTIASWYADMGQNIDFATLATTGQCPEQLQVDIIRERRALDGRDPDEYAADTLVGDLRLMLSALEAYADEIVPVIIGCWSSFGHNFQSTDTPLEESCMQCGGVWRRVRREDDPSMADYQASNGDDPIQCPDISPCHGDAPCTADNGRPCEDQGEGEPCSHESFECNCLYCTG
ncbi:hypothetical protein [Streptomyces sp. NPDC018584]|uniref:hypothetical protein n=1 Tax=unclassified Streptomyces TaxID=2593676 RepID=UPI00378ED811